MIGYLLAAIAGVVILAIVLWDAFETVLLPRRIGRKIRLTRMFYAATWRVCRGMARRERKPSRREAILGFYGPLSLLLLLICWAAGLILAFALLQFGAESLVVGGAVKRISALLYMSGETFFTLGFGDITPTSAWGRLLAVMEAGMGFAFLGTVIGYLPTIYSSFSQREIEISLLDARAGSPPTAAEFLRRSMGAGYGRRPEEILGDWERWSAQILETHISYPLLGYYRSQHSNQSWLASLTAILDSSAVVLAGGAGMPTQQAQLTFAMARHALVDVTQIFVSSRGAPGPDRLPPAMFQKLRERLRGTPLEAADPAKFEAKLAALRRQYEPYAEALAAYLLLELPPWVHETPRKDNWLSGPWDRELGAPKPAVLWDEEHF